MEAPIDALLRIQWMKAWPLVRDVALFLCGVAGIAYETVFTQVDRPTLLLLFAAMVGLPAFLRTDEKHKDDE
jgi:uncharacterized membrane protein